MLEKLNSLNSENGKGFLLFYQDCQQKKALHIKHGLIQYAGAKETLPGELNQLPQADLGDRCLLPGFIDCHTHLIFVGSRADELHRRVAGATYQEIAASGGGIAKTVAATQRAPFEELLHSASVRLASHIQHSGVTTVEIKSGYGLNFATERKLLQVAAELEKRFPVSVQKTYLGAHKVPQDAKSADDYIETLCCHDLPALAAEGLVDAVDIFCETIAFNLGHMERLFATAAQLGLPVKVHAEQLSAMGASGRAANLSASSADHLEYASEADVSAMKRSGTIPVLLPGSFYYLGQEGPKPPVDLFRKHGLRPALATDFNPGSSPYLSLPFIMHLGIMEFGLTTAECLAGVTEVAAQALRLPQVGKLEAGFVADLSVWNFDDPQHFGYGLIPGSCLGTFSRGRFYPSSHGGEQ